jgi:hypothetical protein
MLPSRLKALTRTIAVAVTVGAASFVILFVLALIFRNSLPVVGPVSLKDALTTSNIAETALVIATSLGLLTLILGILRSIRPVQPDRKIFGFPVVDKIGGKEGSREKKP